MEPTDSGCDWTEFKPSCSDDHQQRHATPDDYVAPRRRQLPRLLAQLVRRSCACMSPSSKYDEDAAIEGCEPAGDRQGRTNTDSMANASARAAPAQCALGAERASSGQHPAAGGAAAAPAAAIAAAAAAAPAVAAAPASLARLPAAAAAAAGGPGSRSTSGQPTAQQQPWRSHLTSKMVGRAASAEVLQRLAVLTTGLFPGLRKSTSKQAVRLEQLRSPSAHYGASKPWHRGLRPGCRSLDPSMHFSADRQQLQQQQQLSGPVTLFDLSYVTSFGSFPSNPQQPKESESLYYTAVMPRGGRQQRCADCGQGPRSAPNVTCRDAAGGGVALADGWAEYDGAAGATGSLSGSYCLNDHACSPMRFGGTPQASVSFESDRPSGSNRPSGSTTAYWAKRCSAARLSPSAAGRPTGLLGGHQKVHPGDVCGGLVFRQRLSDPNNSWLNVAPQDKLYSAGPWDRQKSVGPRGRQAGTGRDASRSWHGGRGGLPELDADAYQSRSCHGGRMHFAGDSGSSSSLRELPTIEDEHALTA